MRTAGTRLVTSVVALTLVAGCPGDPDDEASGISDKGLVLSSVDYVADWLWGKATPGEDGFGWRVRTDLGYQVHVSAGYLVNYSASLAACDLSEAATGLVDRLVGTRRARAGHGDTVDASTTEAPRVEDLAQPSSLVLGRTTFEATSYCRVHYLIGAASATGTVDLPADVDLVGTSLWLQGSWRRDGDDEATPFTIETTIANSALDNLDDVLLHPAAVGARHANVRVIRRLDTLLDGIELADADPSEAGRDVLVALIRDTTITVALH